MSINCIASGTITAGGVATIASLIALTMVESTAALVVLSVVAIFAVCFTYAAISAWTVMEEDAKCSDYFSKIAEHLMAIIPAVITAIGQIFATAVVQGAAQGLGDRAYDAFSGRDRNEPVVHVRR